MKADIIVRVPSVVEIKPGDTVVLNIDGIADLVVDATVYKMVETASGAYAVFTNGTWRPMTTYGVTWKKKWGL